MNPLSMYPKVRNALYLVQWILSGALLIITAVVLVVTEGNSPLWLTATTAGFNAFTVFTGRTAQSNTDTEMPVFYDDGEEILDRDEDDDPLPFG